MGRSRRRPSLQATLAIGLYVLMCVFVMAKIVFAQEPARRDDSSAESALPPTNFGSDNPHAALKGAVPPGFAGHRSRRIPRRRCKACRRAGVHELSHTGKQKLFSHRARHGVARRCKGRCTRSRLRNLPRRRLCACTLPDDQGIDHRLHSRLRHHDHRADRRVPRLPLGWAQESMAGLYTSALRPLLQRLPQSDGTCLG